MYKSENIDSTDIVEAEKLTSSWRTEAELRAIASAIVAIKKYVQAAVCIYAFSVIYHLIKSSNF